MPCCRWEHPLILTRAPGRLDVMGGIADYSGSLVLQMPISEACCVALQVTESGDQRLWKHIEARHAKHPSSPRPVLRIVSLDADKTNRGPAYDIDMDELHPGGGVPGYSEARQLFQVGYGGLARPFTRACSIIVAFCTFGVSAGEEMQVCVVISGVKVLKTVPAVMLKGVFTLLTALYQWLFVLPLPAA